MYSLWQELQRRRVVRAGISYLAGAFIALQAAELVLSGLPVPTWLYPTVLTIALAGFPLTLVLAWIFDIRDGHIVRADSATSGRFVRRLVIAGLVLVTLTGGGWATATQLRGDAPLDPNLVAVFPFRTSSTDPLIADLSAGMVDLLAAKLTGAVGPRAVDPRTTMIAWKGAGGEDALDDALRRAARELRAGRMLQGSIVPAGAQIVITASLTPIGWGREVKHSVTGPADSIATLVDQLAASLLSLGAGEDEDRLDALMSASMPALHSYLQARAAYRGGDYTTARDLFLDALNKDTTFALAGIGFEAAAGWTNNTPAAVRDRAKRLAFTARDRLGTADRLMLNAFIGEKYPEFQTQTERCVAWRRAYQELPGNPEAAHGAADCMFHFGQIEGHVDYLEKARVLFEQSVALDSTYSSNLEHLLSIAVMTNDSALAARIKPIAERAHTSEQRVDRIRWWAAYASGDSATVHEMATRFPQMSNANLHAIASMHELAGRGIVWADSARNVIARSATPAVPAAQVRYALMHGRVAEAQALIEAPARQALGTAHIGVLLMAMYAEMDPAFSAQFVDFVRGRIATAKAQALPGAPTPLPSDQCILAQWDAWQGRTEGLLQLAALIEAGATAEGVDDASREARRVCGIALRAIEATLARRAPDAKRLTHALDTASMRHDTRIAADLYLRMLVARLFEMNGDVAAARTALNRAPVYLDTDWFRESRLRESARLSEALGERDRAIREYSHYLALREHATGHGVSFSEQARAALARLNGESR